MDSANLTRQETATRSANVTLDTVRVEFDFTNAQDKSATGFSVVTTHSVKSATSESWIDFLGESVERVTINGTDIPVNWDGARIKLTGLQPDSVIRIEAIAPYSRTGEGLHRFVDPVDGETYLYSHYEPADARRAMPCFEQPDMKGRYTFLVNAPVGWKVLSNQSALHETNSVTEFAETLPLSSYITAVAAGPYHEVKSNSTEINLGVFCRKSLAEHLEAEEIFEVTNQGLKFFQEAFDYPYVWGKYDQIFVPEYNIGAMENPGLITFNESLLFKGHATEAQREARANIILHEMAHMWFGDLVTMKWWDDLWLKESFADFMGTYVAAHHTRFTDAWVTFANKRKAWAYEQDQLPSTHPIIADIVDLEAAKLNFDGITYAKGASVLRQLVAYVGEDEFFAASQSYFKKFAYGNTTFDDLLKELSAQTDKDVFGWAEKWLQTSGVTTLTIDSGSLIQDQPRPQIIRVGGYELLNNRLQRVADLPMQIADRSTPLNSHATLQVINDHDLSYAKGRISVSGLDIVEEYLNTIDDALTRAIIWSQLWNQTRDAELGASRFMRILAKQAPKESNSSLLATAIQNAGFALANFVGNRHKIAARAEWLEVVWRSLWSAEPASDSQLSWARALAETASSNSAKAPEIRAMLADKGAVPEGLDLGTELHWQLLTALIASGEADADQADAMLKTDNTGSGRSWYARAIATQPSEKQASWEAIWFDESLSNERLSALIAGFRTGDSANIDAQYFDLINDTWADSSIEMAKRRVIGLYPRGHLGDEWLQNNVEAPAALRRLVIEARDHEIRADLARKADV